MELTIFSFLLFHSQEIIRNIFNEICLPNTSLHQAIVEFFQIVDTIYLFRLNLEENVNYKHNQLESSNFKIHSID